MFHSQSNNHCYRPFHPSLAVLSKQINHLPEFSSYLSSVVRTVNTISSCYMPTQYWKQTCKSCRLGWFNSGHTICVLSSLIIVNNFANCSLVPFLHGHRSANSPLTPHSSTKRESFGVCVGILTLDLFSAFVMDVILQMAIANALWLLKSLVFGFKYQMHIHQWKVWWYDIGSKSSLL